MGKKFKPLEPLFCLISSLLAESFLETQAGIIPVAFLMCLPGSKDVNEPVV
jgi:hypothetical protein